MNIVDALQKEFEHEAQTTRKLFERLPDDKLEWQPHPKSFTAAELASHITECVGWTVSIFNEDEIDIDPTTYKPYIAKSTAELLETFAENVARSKEALAGATEEILDKPWAFKVQGKVFSESTKAEVFRDVALSHVIHHRGQLSVYLRLLDIPVPGAYGPSADEAAP